MFHNHPAIQTARLNILDTSFPGLTRVLQEINYGPTNGMNSGPEKKISGLNYILAVDESSYNPKADWGEKKGVGMGKLHPIAWYHAYDGGRSFYTARPYAR